MAADILSLSKARKAKARAADARQAEENRIRFGRTKAEKLQVKSLAEHNERKAEAHRIVPVAPAPKPPSDA